MTSPLPLYVSVRDAAELMGVRERTVRNLVVAGGCGPTAAARALSVCGSRTSTS